VEEEEEEEEEVYVCEENIYNPKLGYSLAKQHCGILFSSSVCV
jgi:hypothetical protein